MLEKLETLTILTHNDEETEVCILGGAVRRINRRMNSGHSLSSARSYEASRINATRRRARIAGSIGGAAAGVGATMVATYLSTQNPTMASVYAIPIVTGAGALVGRYATQSAVMLAGGYSPGKFR